MDELKRLVDRLANEVHGLRGEMRRRIRWLAAVMLTVIVVGGSLVWWNRLSIERNNQRWCGTLNILTDPAAPPPTTPHDRDQLAQLDKLRTDFNCQRQEMPS